MIPEEVIGLSYMMLPDCVYNVYSSTGSLATLLDFRSIYNGNYAIDVGMFQLWLGYYSYETAAFGELFNDS